MPELLIANEEQRTSRKDLTARYQARAKALELCASHLEQQFWLMNALELKESIFIVRRFLKQAQVFREKSTKHMEEDSNAGR